MSKISMFVCFLCAVILTSQAQIPQQIDPSEDEVHHLSDNPKLIWVLILVIGVLVVWYYVARRLNNRSK